MVHITKQFVLILYIEYIPLSAGMYFCGCIKEWQQLTEELLLMYNLGYLDTITLQYSVTLGYTNQSDGRFNLMYWFNRR